MSSPADIFAFLLLLRALSSSPSLLSWPCGRRGAPSLVRRARRWRPCRGVLFFVQSRMGEREGERDGKGRRRESRRVSGILRPSLFCKFLIPSSRLSVAFLFPPFLLVLMSTTSSRCSSTLPRKEEREREKKGKQKPTAKEEEVVVAIEAIAGRRDFPLLLLPQSLLVFTFSVSSRFGSRRRARVSDRCRCPRTWRTGARSGRA